MLLIVQYFIQFELLRIYPLGQVEAGSPRYLTITIPDPPAKPLVPPLDAPPPPPPVFAVPATPTAPPPPMPPVPFVP